MTEPTAPETKLKPRDNRSVIHVRSKFRQTDKGMSGEFRQRVPPKTPVGALHNDAR